MQRNKFFELVDRMNDPMIGAFKDVYQDYVPGDHSGLCVLGNFWLGHRDHQ
jgi:hypothetical protein